MTSPQIDCDDIVATLARIRQPATVPTPCSEIGST